MFIGRNKAIFALMKCSDFVQKTKYYKIEGQYSKTIQFGSMGDQFSFELEVDSDLDKVKKISIRSHGESVNFGNNNSVEKEMKSLYDVSIKRIRELEDEKFQRAFPEYNSVESERDFKLTDLLTAVDSKKKPGLFNLWNFFKKNTTAK